MNAFFLSLYNLWRINDMASSLDALNAKVDSLDAKINILTPLVADLKTQIASLSNAGGATPAQLDALSARIQKDNDALDLIETPPTPPAP